MWRKAWIRVRKSEFGSLFGQQEPGSKPLTSLDPAAFVYK